VSHFATPEGEQEGGPLEAAARPSGLELILGSALIERTANAIQAEALRLERDAAARKAYLSQLKESFAVSEGPSGTCPSSDGPSVRATARKGASGDAGASCVQPAPRRDP
jgi:hypothetical protein